MGDQRRAGRVGRREPAGQIQLSCHNGFAAKTGKANFDISEWMLIRLLEGLSGRPATLAMLRKTATARKVLRHAWGNGFDLGESLLHVIDAARHLDVSVDACLLLVHTGCSDGD